MKNELFRKALAITTIGFLIGLCVMPSINAAVESHSNELINCRKMKTFPSIKQETGDCYSGVAFIVGIYANSSKDENWFNFTAVQILLRPIPRITPRDPWDPWLSFISSFILCKDCRMRIHRRLGFGRIIGEPFNWLVGIGVVETLD